MQKMVIQQSTKPLNYAFVFFPAGDELHKSLSSLAEPPPPSSPIPQNQAPKVVSAWLSSRNRTLTRGPEPHRSPMLTRNCLLLFLWILLDDGSVSSLRPPSPQLGRGKTGRERVRTSAGPMRNGAAGFQRVKRGWVWNQFFVLEEYMGSDPQYVGKVRKKKGEKGLFFNFFLWGHKSHSKELGRN